jgi:hypothetical protein
MSGADRQIKPLAWRTAVKPGSSARTVADLGSDPHSAKQSSQGMQRITEWGSDPNSAGHGWQCLSAKLPYRRARISVSACGEWLTVARRIGVRAQFGDAPATMDTSRGRIGIRPQICYRSWLIDRVKKYLRLQIGHDSWCTGGLEKFPIHSCARKSCGFAPHIDRRWAA